MDETLRLIWVAIRKGDYLVASCAHALFEERVNWHKRKPKPLTLDTAIFVGAAKVAAYREVSKW